MLSLIAIMLLQFLPQRRTSVIDAYRIEIIGDKDLQRKFQLAAALATMTVMNGQVIACRSSARYFWASASGWLEGWYSVSTHGAGHIMHGSSGCLMGITNS